MKFKTVFFSLDRWTRWDSCCETQSRDYSASPAGRWACVKGAAQHNSKSPLELRAACRGTTFLFILLSCASDFLAGARRSRPSRSRARQRTRETCRMPGRGPFSRSAGTGRARDPLVVSLAAPLSLSEPLKVEKRVPWLHRVTNRSPVIWRASLESHTVGFVGQSSNRRR